MNLAKDIGYNALNVAKILFSRGFIRAVFASNTTALMNQWHSMLILKEAVAHFGQVKRYYKQVLQLKHQIGGGSTSSESVA
jgi:hypothetical protein